MRRLKGFITITAILWGMIFALPLMYGEATFDKSAFVFTKHNRLFVEKLLCGRKFEIPATFDECNGFKIIKVPRPNKYYPYFTTDRSYKVKPFVFECYDFSEKSKLLSITDIHGKTLLMVGDKVIKDER